MPQYFNNAYQSTAFSDGLMVGFNFVDSIRQRRRQLELEERQQNRLDRQMELAEGAAARAAESHQLQMEAGRYNLGRAQIEDEREDTLFEQDQSERARMLRMRDESEAALRDVAASMANNYRRRTSLGSIGSQPVLAQAPAAQPAAPAPAPAAPEAPSGPVDLRTAQRERDAQPGLLKRLVTGGKPDTGAKNRWEAVANPDRDGVVIRQGGRGADITADQIRRRPIDYVPRYLKERDQVSPEARASIDLTMSNALREERERLLDQAQNLDPADSRGLIRVQQSLARVEGQMNALSKATISSAAKDAGITRPVKKEDPRATEAIVSAATRAREIQPIQEVTPDELRAAQAVWNRTENSPRLNEKQIAAGTTLFVNGIWSAQDLDNYLRYGTPVAPQRPTPLAIGGGRALLITDDGYTIIDTGGGGSGDGFGGLSASQVRLRQRDNLERIQKNFENMMATGVLPTKGTIIGRGNPATVGEYERMFHDFVKRLGPQIQMQSGIPAIGPNGELTYALMDPAEVDSLQNAFVEYFMNERADLFGPDSLRHQGRDPASYLPGVIDLTNEEF